MVRWITACALVLLTVVALGTLLPAVAVEEPLVRRRGSLVVMLE